VTFDWDKHWWLIIILAALAVPIVQAIFEPWNRYLRYRRQRDAIDALKVYAAQGREPPPAVLDALGGRRFRWQAAAETVADAATAKAADKRSRRQDRWERRWEYRNAAEPLRRWNWAIFAGAVTLGFSLAWRYGHQNNDAYLIVAIIAGALTAAGVVTALLATFWRID
jgi:hypothetical protein